MSYIESELKGKLIVSEEEFRALYEVYLTAKTYFERDCNDFWKQELRDKVNDYNKKYNKP